MCGIVGFKTNRDFVSLEDSLPEAASCLSHRGPDDTGLFLDKDSGIGLGHARLAIIDLTAAGRQPMTSEDGRVRIVYNGEVYNFREIRKTLEKRGHLFRSATDSEVVLKAYVEWGIDCLHKFVGMFAMALWDARKKCMFLARDRLGIKPLYYYYSAGRLLFASELKALMALKAFPRELNSSGLSLFLHYQYIPAPRTIFRDTFKLLPGHYAVYDGRTLRVLPFWEFPERDEGAMAKAPLEGEILEELDYLLTQAVSDRLVSDVPLGALLSGGIDSSVVTALMQKVNSAPIRTFSIGFSDEQFDEAPWARRVAGQLGTEHTEFYVTGKEALDVVPLLPEMYDEPFGDSSAIPTYLISRLARSQVTVALSGDGGDEQFCGYVRYWSTRAIADTFYRLPDGVRKILGVLLAKLPSEWVSKCYRPLRRHLPGWVQVANFQAKWRKLQAGLMGGTDLMELYRATICLWGADDILTLTGQELPECLYEEVFRKSQTWPIISRLMRIDQSTYLVDDLLTKVDRASMAVSLEVRVPLLDHRVVEYTSSLPEDLKYRDGMGKYLLKKLLARYVPNKLFQRPKMGFGVPLDRWFRDELKELLLSYLSPARLKEEGLFDEGLVEQKMCEHLSGRASHGYHLWSLLMWEMWRERWLG